MMRRRYIRPLKKRRVEVLTKKTTPRVVTVGKTSIASVTEKNNNSGTVVVRAASLDEINKLLGEIKKETKKWYASKQKKVESVTSN